jgi:hypothetical protein
MATKLFPVGEIPAYAVIIRCVWERGTNQTDAVAELARRGLWLAPEQIAQGALVKIEQAPWYVPAEALP